MAYSTKELSSYLNALVPERPAEMQKMEAYAEEHGFPIIGPAAGYHCYLLARLSGARSVFELGSGYGYSAAWFARAVDENGGGIVHHVVWDEELSQRAKRHLSALGYGNLIRYEVSEAVAALSRADGQFDLVFMDIDKQGYADAIPVITEKLKPGGVLIADNALLSGRVMNATPQDSAAQSVRAMTNLLVQSDAWLASIVPIRDGLLVAYKAS